jgi:hypothetical protein
MAKTFVGKNIERGVNSISTPVNEETAKLKEMNRQLKEAKKPGMEWTISIKDLQVMETALAAINAILNKVDVNKVNKLITGARKFIGGWKKGIAAAKLAASAVNPTVGANIEVMQIGKTYIEDGEETIEGVALPSMTGIGAQLSNSKGLVVENATLIKEVKAVKETGVDPKQAILDSKWTKALREGTTVSFYLESEENKKFIDDNPFRYQIVLDEAKVTGQLSKVARGGDVNIQNRMKVEVENHHLMVNLQSDYNDYHDMVNKIKRREEEISDLIANDTFGDYPDDAAWLEELNAEVSQLKSSRDQSGSRLLETKKTYKDNLTTLKSIGAGKTSTGMLNNREVMALGSSSKNSLTDAVQYAMFIARNFSLTLGMNVTYIDKAEVTGSTATGRYSFQLMWDLSKDQNGMFKLVIVLENRPA